MTCQQQQAFFCALFETRSSESAGIGSSISSSKSDCGPGSTSQVVSGAVVKPSTEPCTDTLLSEPASEDESEVEPEDSVLPELLVEDFEEDIRSAAPLQRQPQWLRTLKHSQEVVNSHRTMLRAFQECFLKNKNRNS